MAKITSPERFHALVAGCLSLILAGLLFAAFRFPWTWYHLLAVWLVGVNVVTFGYYGYDKGQARGEGGRVPEVVLHGLAVCGGTLGAWLGMNTFRHKTIKSEFRMVFWVIAVGQGLLVVALIYRLFTHQG
jgi:uncharacterized membrane protein YsdA (DUF1294 family)